MYTVIPQMKETFMQILAYFDSLFHHLEMLFLSPKINIGAKKSLRKWTCPPPFIQKHPDFWTVR